MGISLKDMAVDNLAWPARYEVTGWATERRDLAPVGPQAVMRDSDQRP
jgi:hypothetical protein